MFSLFLHDAWKILVASLILGAGLPALYAVGVRSLAIGTTASAGTAGNARVVDQGDSRSRLGIVLASICFALVIAGVAVGLLYIVASGQGKMLSFDHVYPTIVPKS